MTIFSGIGEIEITDILESLIKRKKEMIYIDCSSNSLVLATNEVF